MTHVAPDPDRDDIVEIRAPRGRPRRLVMVLAILLVVGLLAAGGAAFWVQRQIDPPGAPGKVVQIEIPTGTSTAAIGDLLEHEGVIASAFVWENLYVRFRSIGPFEAGFYELRANSSIGDVIDVLEQGPLPPPFIRLTVAEGLTVREIIERLADPERGIEGFTVSRLQQLLDSGRIRSKYQPAGQTSMEGLLFPETYQIENGEGEEAVLRRLVRQLDDTLDRLQVQQRAAALGLTPYELIIVASLIEEESKVPEERDKIARVIYNRLEQGIALGIDATSRYEAELAGRSRNDIDFESDSPYNTRRIPGLPPTPIAVPGLASIEAALRPAAGPWIYYVLQDAEGHHFFTDSAAEFERAKAECARNDLGCG
jgi:UPF0755 protein